MKLTSFTSMVQVFWMLPYVAFSMNTDVSKDDITFVFRD